MLLEVDDRQLVFQCKDGQEEAYRHLLSRYEGYVYGLCYRLTNRREDALELAQETWIKVFAGLASFQVNLPFKPWLRKVALNVCLNSLRQQHPDLLSLEEEGLPAPSAAEPQVLVEWGETRQMLREALKKLPPPWQLVMVLRHQEDLSYEEISSATGLPLGTVKTYLFRARRSLRQNLADTYGWEVSDP